jgi:hypothetical protein
MKTGGYHNKKACSVVSIMLFFSPPFMDTTRLETQAPWWAPPGCYGYGPGDLCNRYGVFL